MRGTSSGARAARIGLTYAALGLLGGCGTYVPSHQEGGGLEQALALEGAIVQSVHCELRTALYDVLHKNEQHAYFTKDWAVQVALTLTVDETTTVNPTIGMTFLPSLFTLGVSGNASTAATRVDTFNFYYPVKTLLDRGPCDPNFPEKFPHPSGSLLIRSDLKTKEWLLFVLSNKVTVDSEDPKNGMQHKVTFVVDTSGGVTPGAALATVTLMPAGVFLAAGRKRTHDLTLTFGPADSNQKEQKVLASSAQSMFQAGQIVSALQGTGTILRGRVIP